MNEDRDEEIDEALKALTSLQENIGDDAESLKRLEAYLKHLYEKKAVIEKMYTKLHEDMDAVEW